MTEAWAKDALIAQLQVELSAARALFAKIESPLRDIVDSFNEASAALDSGAPPLPAPQPQAKESASPAFAALEGVRWEPLHSTAPSTKIPTAISFVDGIHPGTMAHVLWLPRVTEMLAEAKRILGWNVLTFCKNASGSDLRNDIKRSFPAAFVAGLAALEKVRVLDEESATRPQAMLSGGLTSLTVLCAAGMLPFADALGLANVTASAIEQATKKKPQVTADINGLSRHEVESLCLRARSKDTSTASPLCAITVSLGPKRFICAGTRSTVESLCNLAEASGALWTQIVRSHAVGTPLLQQPAVEISRALDAALPQMKAPKCDLWFHASQGTRTKLEAGTTPSIVLEAIKLQLTRAARPDEVCGEMVADGIQRFYEVGPAMTSFASTMDETIRSKCLDAFV